MGAILRMQGSRLCEGGGGRGESRTMGRLATQSKISVVLKHVPLDKRLAKVWQMSILIIGQC